MAKSAGSSGAAAGWVAPTLLLVGLVTGMRVVLLAFDRTDLWVDEAQYWLWGRELALGYYSKPPLIGWLIGAVTRMAGSDSAFWVRLPAPLLHGATAMVLAGMAAQWQGRRAALWVAAGYITLPMVAVGSQMISTDTVMFPFLALALAGWIGLCRAPSGGLAVGCGVALGLAVLAKYAALYYLPCAALAAVLVPQARPPVRFVLLALVALVLTMSPTLVWNVQNGFQTVAHTLDNADWVRDPATRAALDPVGLAGFVASQFAVLGPVPFGLLLVSGARALRRGGDPVARVLLAFCVPILIAVCAQALVSRAYANWAAAGYLAGSVAVFAAMRGLAPGWRMLSFAVNGLICVALPVAAVFPDQVAWGDRLLLSRYLGRADMSARVVAAAVQAGAAAVVAEDRGMLADLFYHARSGPLPVFSVPPAGPARNHYAASHPFPGGTAAVLFVGPGASAPDCIAPGSPAIPFPAQTDAWARRPVTAFLVPGDCWTAQR